MKNKRESEEAARAARREERRAAKERRKQAPVLERRAPIRAVKPRMLIYSEGANTEPSYFNQFRLSNIDVQCFGEGRNTLSLVQRAIILRDEAATNEKPYEQIWCVFDRDPSSANKGGHSPQKFNDAVWLAEKENIGLAYSIQAFEYWLILHFNDHQGGTMPRDDYDALLNSYLKPFSCTYDGKGSKIISKEFFDVLEARDEQTGKRRRVLAKERAERIFNKLPHTNPASEESCTSVFRLIAILTEP